MRTTSILVFLAATVACGGTSGTASDAGVDTAPLPDAASPPIPTGMFVLNEAFVGKTAATAYATGLVSSPAYASAIAGHAIFIPLIEILPSVTTWGQFAWDFGYVDTLAQIATSHGKKITLELEVGYEDPLPAGFDTACPGCAPLFHVWTVGGAMSRCIDVNIPLPWNPSVQQMWAAAATALAAHLKQTGAYDSVVMVHVPGVSIYDEELRLPSGRPAPASTDTATCPDNTVAAVVVPKDAEQTRWQGLGYSDANVVAGWTAIATSFAQAFPEPYLGVSFIAASVDFPSFEGHPQGYVAEQVAMAAANLAPGRFLFQDDSLDITATATDTEVTSLAQPYGFSVGWQSNRHGGTGAACDGMPCADGATASFYNLLAAGATGPRAGRYFETWSADVVAYPQAFATAASQGMY